MDLTICGSFGFGNAGDEAVPLALCDLAKSLDVDLRMSVVGRYAAVDLPEVIGLGEHDQDRRYALRGQPLLFVGGGVVEPREQCVLLRGQQLIRELSPSKTGMFAAAIEPFVDFPWRVRHRLKKVIRSLDLCSVRDVLSAGSLLNLIPNFNADVTGDIVLWMDADPSRPAECSDLSRYIAVNLVNRWDGNLDWFEWITLHLLRIAREHDAAVVFVPCTVKHDDDSVVHREIARALRDVDSGIDVRVITRPLLPRELSATHRDAIVTIGMRLHACIMSYAQRTPCVGLVYHPKLIGFARTAGIEPFFLPADPPDRQSAGHHGYRFDDLNLSDCDLSEVVSAALNDFSFDRLDAMRSSLRDAFATFATSCMPNASCPQPRTGEIAA